MVAKGLAAHFPPDQFLWVALRAVRRQPVHSEIVRYLWEHLRKGDIILGDRAFGEYSTLAQLPRQGVDVVARLHHQRKVDFLKAKQLAKDDGLFVWAKGYEQSGLATARQWQQMPAQILVRILRFTATIRGFRNRRVTLLTALLDPQLYPARQIIALYGRRWSLALCFRDLKTTMGMEALRCQSPEMAEKELLVYLVAHNLVRCVMAEAVTRYQVPLERISFKGSLDALRQYSAAMAHGTQPNTAPTIMGGFVTQPSPGFVSPQTQPSRATRGQTPAQSLSAAQINRAAASSKSPTAAAAGKTAPPIIDPLSKDHSRLTPFTLKIGIEEKLRNFFTVPGNIYP